MIKSDKYPKSVGNEAKKVESTSDVPKDMKNDDVRVYLATYPAAVSNQTTPVPKDVERGLCNAQN